MMDAPSHLHLPKLVAFAPDGTLVFYSCIWDAAAGAYHSPQLAACCVNGRHWRAVSLRERLLCMTLNQDGTLLATGSDAGHLELRRVHESDAAHQCAVGG